jgi:poly(3-hydroxybutyrate) depolymerase
MRIISVSLLLLAMLACETRHSTEGEVEPTEGEGEPTEGEGEPTEGEGEPTEGEGEPTEGEGEPTEGEGEPTEGEGETTGTLVAGNSEWSATVAGQTRAALLFVPAVAGPMPLMVALHGNGDSDDNFVASLGLAELAVNAGAVLVAPQGLQRTITAFGQTIPGLSWDPYNNLADNIDLQLLDALIADLVATGSIDTSAITVFGYSQGGFMSYRYCIDHSTTIASCVVAAAFSPLTGLSASRPLPMALRIGANDPQVDGARGSRDALQGAGHEVLYEEIAGAGHVPFPGDPAPLVTWLLDHRL